MPNYDVTANREEFDSEETYKKYLENVSSWRKASNKLMSESITTKPDITEKWNRFIDGFYPIWLGFVAGFSVGTLFTLFICLSNY